MEQVIEEVVGPDTVFAEMRVAVPEDMPPDDISGVLQLQPTGRGSGICRASERKKAAWVLSTWDRVKSGKMNVHLKWLLHLLMPVKYRIVTLQKVPGISMRVRCVWGSKECDTSAYFSPEHIKKWAELNMDFTFELYSDSGD
jgi:hypothetical protein